MIEMSSSNGTQNLPTWAKVALALLGVAMTAGGTLATFATKTEVSEAKIEMERKILIEKSDRLDWQKDFKKDYREDMDKVQKKLDDIIHALADKQDRKETQRNTK